MFDVAHPVLQPLLWHVLGSKSALVSAGLGGAQHSVLSPSLRKIRICKHCEQQVAMSYYVGAEPKNPVQCEKFWRNRIDAEEAHPKNSLIPAVGCFRSLTGSSCSGHGELYVALRIVVHAHHMGVLGFDVACMSPRMSEGSCPVSWRCLVAFCCMGVEPLQDQL